MTKVYVYVVDRDFGFAPNPFHGVCTLATCKARIRNSARIGDWVIGMGGGRLQAAGRCVFAMQVTDKITFDEYWSNPAYHNKKPVRNGSSKMMVGDNIYHRDEKCSNWIQADSHHSKVDGSANPANVANDTKSPNVLISTKYLYFGRSAPEIPARLLSTLGYKNGRNHRVFDGADCQPLIDWILINFGNSLNEVSADPFDFEESQRRYSAGDNRIS